MSALLPEADIHWGDGDVCFVPNGDIRSRIEIAAETPSARSSRIEIARLYNEVGTAHKRVL